MYPMNITPAADPAQTSGPAQPAAPDPAAQPTPDPAAQPTPDPAAQPTPDPATKSPQAGDVVNIRFDNGRGTVVEQAAIVIRTVDVPDVTDGQQKDSTHLEYDVAPVTTMRVGADHLVDDEG